MHNDAMTKAMQSALDVAQQRQQWGAAALQNVVPADGVLLSVKSMRQGGGLEQLVWPGILRQLDASGVVLAQTHAADMFEQQPQAAALLMVKANGRPVRRTEFMSPQGSKLIAYMDAAGVLYVRSHRTKELLAVSEPGQPAKLRADFQPLKPEDLKPRLR